MQSVFECNFIKPHQICSGVPSTQINSQKSGGEIVIISCYCCRQAQQPVLFCKHFSDPEKSVQHLCNIIVITQIVCTFLLNGGMTKTDQPVPRLCYCFLYTHLSPLCPLSRGQDFFCILQGTCYIHFLLRPGLSTHRILENTIVFLKKRSYS